MNSPEPVSFQTVLVVDDERASLDAIRRTLEEDFVVLTASSAEEARQLMLQATVSVLLCDQRMPGTSGVQFLTEVRERWPDVVRIILSGYTDSEDIIAGINDAGIYRYLMKPWFPDHLLETVRGAAAARTLQGDLRRLDLELRPSPEVLRLQTSEKLSRVQSNFDFSRIVRAEGSPLDQVCELASRVARFDLPVLLLGESGTGKELLARAIHYASPRASHAFVVENCAAVTDTLLESELFGHKRGSFTGAHEDHVGLFQRADGGTVFLDEIGDTSPSFQVKLLRVLQESEVRPVGATRAIPVNVRVLAATHRDLEEDVRQGRFRADLYYRIAGVTVNTPPLRSRPADIIPVAEHLLAQACRELGLNTCRFSADARAALVAYDWPGNVRELRNEIYRALAVRTDGGGQVDAESLSIRVRQGRASHSERTVSFMLPQTGTLQERIDAMEAAILKETLMRCRWNKTHVASELGLSRVGLRNKMLRLGLEKK